MSLKIENSRRVAKSRPVCMDLYGLVDSSMAKASFLGVVSFGRFVPDWGSGSVTMLTVMVNLPKNS
jgi:hypothetical protein